MPTFKNIFAIDPTDLTKVAANAEVVIFAPGDASKAPLALTDVTGLPLTNPITTNEYGFGPGFMTALDEVAWSGGDLSGTMESFTSLKEVSVAARDASALSAQEASASKTAAQAAGVDAGTSAAAQVSVELGAARAAAEQAADDAAAAAGLVGAPAGEAVLAAVSPGGAAHGALSAAIDERAPGISRLTAREQIELRHALEVAAHGYADFENGRFSQWGAQVQAHYVTDSTDGKVRPIITNLLGSRVPFVAGGAGGFPVGWEKYNAAGYLVAGAITPEEFAYVATTNAASLTDIAGMRTTEFILASSTNYAVSMDTDLSNFTAGDLFKARLGVQNTSGTTFTFAPSWQYPNEGKSRGYRRFTTPAGATTWKFAVYGVSLDAVADRGGTFKVGNPLVYVAPNLPMGYDFFGCAVEARATAKTVAIKELLPSTRYMLLLRTTQGGLVTIYATSTAGGVIDLLTVFPGGTIDVQEMWAVLPADYREGMATAAAEAPAFQAVRLIDGADWAHSQPESAELVARATGLMRNFANPQNPKGPRSINVDQRRLHHLKFRTLPGEAFIGDSTGGNSSQRSELSTGYAQPFNTPLWVNFGVILHEELTDSTASDKLSVFWQCRYEPNGGENTGFSPEISLMQRPGKKLRLQLISDNGVFQTAGTGSGSLGEPNAPVNNTTTLIDFDYEPGEYLHVWMKFVTSNNGGGSMHLKINGVTVYNATIPIGYNRTTGPMVRFGSYKYSVSPANTEFFGTILPTTVNLDGFDVLPVPGI